MSQTRIKAVILAGGRGTRLSEETEHTPKPMVEVGGKPIIWHIMKLFSAGGIDDFVLCLGYKGYKFKEYFYHYKLHNADVTVDVQHGVTFHESYADPWRITLAETGEDTMTGGRLKRIRKYVQGEELFCMTYGDGVADVDVRKLVAFHRSHGKLATVTAVRPLARFGALVMDGQQVRRFEEKPATEGGLINGGFFVLSPRALDLIDGDATLWEKEPMERLAAQGQMMAFTHEGFWQPMDTLRDKNHLEELWASGKAPWKKW